jgi:hypothetical protein
MFYITSNLFDYFIDDVAPEVPYTVMVKHQCCKYRHGGRYIGAMAVGGGHATEVHKLVKYIGHGQNRSKSALSGQNWPRRGGSINVGSFISRGFFFHIHVG